MNTLVTPKVQYGYADGPENTVRPTSLTYPDGRVLTCSDSAATNNRASRAASANAPGTRGRARTPASEVCYG